MSRFLCKFIDQKYTKSLINSKNTKVKKTIIGSQTCNKRVLDVRQSVNEFADQKNYEPLCKLENTRAR